MFGPDLLHETSPLTYKSTYGGTTVSVRYVSDVWHTSRLAPDFKKPDLVFAAHPGIHEGAYDWDPTLDLLIWDCVPCVLTAWHKQDLFAITNVLKKDTFNASIAFSGAAPFASPVKRYARKSWNKFGVQAMNSHWVGFKGGRPGG